MKRARQLVSQGTDMTYNLKQRDKQCVHEMKIRLTIREYFLIPVGLCRG